MLCEQLNTLASECYRIAYQHGFKSIIDDENEAGARMLLMVTEIVEAFEEVRKGEKLYKIYYINGKPEGIPIELADCIIRILDTCHANGIDIAEAIDIKMKYNEGRPYKHGKIL